MSIDEHLVEKVVSLTEEKEQLSIYFESTKRGLFLIINHCEQCGCGCCLTNGKIAEQILKKCGFSIDVEDGTF